MNQIRFFLLASALLGTIASAQESISYDGKWSASFRGTSGMPATAELALKGPGGTWRYVSNRGHVSNRFPCLDHEFPVVVRSSSPGELTFDIEASKELHDCKDRSVTVKVLDTKNLEGQFGDGVALKLTRE
jgi:hypothetical protein